MPLRASFQSIAVVILLSINHLPWSDPETPIAGQPAFRVQCAATQKMVHHLAKQSPKICEKSGLESCHPIGEERRPIGGVGLFGKSDGRVQVDIVSR